MMLGAAFMLACLFCRVDRVVEGFQGVIDAERSSFRGGVLISNVVANRPKPSVATELVGSNEVSSVSVSVGVSVSVRVYAVVVAAPVTVCLCVLVCRASPTTSA
jgi:hypothetical protein